MTLHRSSGRWRLGLGLTLATALFWATLPIALKVCLEALDPITLTWFRFVVARIADTREASQCASASANAP